ncbi:MAG: hypothetical protein L6428_03755 [Candidatus Aminicenantes bacterium]|nr:hypothetical protein [Candidatus Aminicenantes bacterium]
MKNRAPMANALWIGAAAGLLILGLSGRLITALLAWALAIPTAALTLRSALEPLIAGMIAGALFALPLPWLHKRLPQRPVSRRLTLGLLPFAASIAWMLLKRKPGVWHWHSAITLAAVLLLFLLYGFAADFLFTRCAKKTPTLAQKE